MGGWGLCSSLSFFLFMIELNILLAVFVVVMVHSLSRRHSVLPVFPSLLFSSSSSFPLDCFLSHSIYFTLSHSHPPSFSLLISLIHSSLPWRQWTWGHTRRRSRRETTRRGHPSSKPPRGARRRATGRITGWHSHRHAHLGGAARGVHAWWGGTAGGEALGAGLGGDCGYVCFGGGKGEVE